MLKGLKFLVGLLLLPFCIGGGLTLARLVAQTGDASTIWVAVLAGAACWLVVFLLLPKPMWLYVFGHELTHALWAWLFGGQVKRFKVTAKGGHVVVTKMNFLIGLAPYFFPLYALLVVGVYALGDLLWDWHRYVVWFHLLLGAAYAFHVTLTAQALQVRQSDVTQQGWLFAMSVIFLGNLLVLIVGVPLLTGRTGVLSALGLWLRETGGLLQRLARWF